jgi:hypothetical protein
MHPSGGQTAFVGQGLLAQAGNADAPVIVFAAAVAQLLLQHVAEHVPSEVASALAHQLKQQVTHAAADAVAAGRPFTITDALQQLLPQLSTLATSLLGSMHAAAAAVMPAVSSTGGGGQLTGVEFSPRHNSPNTASHQDQQQQQLCGSPLSAHHSAAHASTALLPSGCAGLPSPFVAAMRPLLQQQQGAWSAEQVPSANREPWAVVDAPQCSECGSTCG